MRVVRQIVDRTGAYVSVGSITSVSPVWEDGGAGTPTVSLAAVNSGTYGQVAIIVADPATPRGNAIVVLSYPDGLGGTATEQVTVNDNRLAANSIIDDAFASTSQARKTFAVVAGKSTWDASDGVSKYYAADGSTILIQDVRSVTGDVTTRTVS